MTFRGSPGGYAFILSAFLTVSCGSDAAPDHEGTTSTPASLPNACTGETRAPAFQAGLSFTASTGVTVKLLSSVPAPPKVGDNAWVVEVDDASGSAVEGATLKVSQFMPDHGHDGVKRPVVTEQGGGKYSLAPVNFNMAGYWENKVQVSTDALDTSVIVKVCVLP